MNTRLTRNKIIHVDKNSKMTVIIVQSAAYSREVETSLELALSILVNRIQVTYR